MYIKTNNRTYPCVGYPVLEGDELRFCLPEGGPTALGRNVTLCQDDGFVLREVDVSGYARHEMQGETLVITNLPAPEPVPPTVREPSDGERARADIDYLALMLGVTL